MEAVPPHDAMAPTVPRIEPGAPPKVASATRPAATRWAPSRPRSRPQQPRDRLARAANSSVPGDSFGGLFKVQMLISAGVIAAIVLWGLLAPASLGAVFDSALALVTHNFGWLYLWVVLGLVVLAIVLAFSRYGDLKLGAPDEEPEFSTTAWFAMLFAPGMGIGLVYWGVAEPLTHYGAPPPGIAPHTPEAANAAMRYAFFHWGLHPWAIYGIVALAIAYFQFRRGSKALISSATETLPWAGSASCGKTRMYSISSPLSTSISRTREFMVTTSAGTSCGRTTCPR